jgi:hydroxylamine dehydrogenase
MPPFPPEAVSDPEVRIVYDYVQSLPPVPGRLRAELPRGVQTRDSCAECHRQYNPAIARQFESSAMGTAGQQNLRVDYPRSQLTCAECHGTNHDTIMQTKGRVPESTCGTCHPAIYKDHVTDSGHSYGPGPGGLGINWERNISVPHYKQMPRKVMEMGCDPCHAQAGATADDYWDEEKKAYKDSSSLTYRNGCIACHTRHSFSLAEARKPESCFTCHMGPDHPNYEAYMSSKHGSIYGARGAGWNWNSALAEAQWDAPTCAYCHMLRIREDGTRYSSHNMSDKIIWGMGVQAADGQLQDITLRPENLQKRNEMIKVCLTCHSEDKARGYLSSADAHKLAGDALVVEARNILADLHQEGLVKPSRGQQTAGLLPGPRFTAIELPTEFAQHWPAGLYYNVGSIEREYFDLFFFSNLKSYKGAFHMSPDYAWWYGYAEALGHLARIRDEAQRLRESDATRRRTLFMIFSGPFMVLAVLGAVYGAWRIWQRRRPSEGA